MVDFPHESGFRLPSRSRIRHDGVEAYPQWLALLIVLSSALAGWGVIGGLAALIQALHL